MLVKVARMEEGGSSWKVSLSEKVVLVLLAVEAGAIKESSRMVLGCAINVCHKGVCREGVCNEGMCPSRVVKAGTGS